jgi:hypothetical protein
VWYAVTVMLLIIFALAAFFYMKSGELQQTAMREALAQESLGVQVEQMLRQQEAFEKEKMQRQGTYTANQLFADRVYDLLDLIPDDAILERFDLDASSLYFEGSCKKFEALKTDMVRALSGAYRLVDTVAVPSGGQTHFKLRFALNGDAS